MRLSAKLPEDDQGSKLMRFDGVRGQRYTEIFLIGGHAITHHLVGGVYNTVGLNDPDGTGDTSPQAVLDKVDMDALKEEYELLSAFKNGPRLWCLDWVEVMVGAERDFHGLEARWVMWLDVPKEMRKHEERRLQGDQRQARHAPGDQRRVSCLHPRRSRRRLLVHEVRQPHRGSRSDATRASSGSATGYGPRRTGRSARWC